VTRQKMSPLSVCYAAPAVSGEAKDRATQPKWLSRKRASTVRTGEVSARRRWIAAARGTALARETKSKLNDFLLSRGLPRTERLAPVKL
jgi:hypothetical protein